MSKRALKKLPRIRERIRRREERLDYLYEKSTTLPSLKAEEKVDKSPKGDPTELLDIIADLESRLRWERHRLDMLSEMANRMIKASGLCEEEKEMMMLRYVKGHTWPEVADLMNYTESNMHKKHRKSLGILFKK